MVKKPHWSERINDFLIFKVVLWPMDAARGRGVALKVCAMLVSVPLCFVVMVCAFPFVVIEAICLTWDEMSGPRER